MHHDPRVAPACDEPVALPVLHADEAIVVCDKPAGWLAVPGRVQHDSLHTRLVAAFGELHVVHRLDMATSGLIVFARHAEAGRRLARAFAERRVAKAYVAVVEGEVAHASGAIALPLEADWPNRPRQRIAAVGGRASLTGWRRIAHERLAGGGLATRLELQPVTGRTHQLRVHCAAIGHPIVGDALYGNVAIAARLCLHATGLGFDHPTSGARIAFTSPAPF
jgi:tRNA pseudouridine32 synthase/23S rRNA pseudouridine746 synthase